MMTRDELQSGATENHDRSFDLTPHPRILPMLGEIVLQQWRCLAELVDNSVDSFLEARRSEASISQPVVRISTPTAVSTGALITVRDNGPGMDWATLESAAKAGWTSHDPINNLGLFGMGFNIATARLGSKTTIWSTRAGDAEWVGLEIDFDKLTTNRSFIAPALIRAKAEPDISGTEVVIERLKQDQLEWFSKGYNRSNISKHLGRIYSSMIGPASYPMNFRLEINGNQVRPRLHCIWGGPESQERVVETARLGPVNAFQPFDKRLDPRPFCTQCWSWLGVNQDQCPSCKDSGVVVSRERRIHGWVGVQRYLDTNDFGIDILRNGRKIETGNKNLFRWFDEDADEEVTEYPLDDPRNRGRIVGEVHLDHCSVPYTKNQFVREDNAWREMVEVVRGNTPLRPDIASRMGAGENTSPLYRLFQAFRRSNPHNKRVGGWAKILVVPGNDRARAMAKRFEAGETGYLTDEKWWELANEADTEVLRTSGSGHAPSETLGGESANPPDTASEGASSAGAGGEVAPSSEPSSAPTRIPSLSQSYVDDLTKQSFKLEAFDVDPTDVAICESSSPWVLRRTTTGVWEFYVDRSSTVFSSMTFTPADALLAHLAWQIADSERGQGSEWTYGAILTSLREKYASFSRLEPANLISEASAQLVDIARSVVGRLSVDDSRSFFDGLSPSRRENTLVTMASRGVANPHGATDDGRYLQYASPSVIRGFVLANPDLFFDGTYWDDSYSSADYGSTVATDEARSRVLNDYAGLLADVVWLAQQTPEDLRVMTRERLMRASLATVLIARTSPSGDEE